MARVQFYNNINPVMKSQIIWNDELSHALTTSFESRRELAVQTRGAIGLDLIFCSTFASRQKWK
ncbi:MAG: hypothetical protein ACJ748_03335 [Flavisolibacter sp.]